MLVFPLVLFAMLLVVQFGVWYHASHVALAAAQEGARAARVADGTAAAGRERAERYLDRLGREVVLERSVTSSRGADDARVEVRGRAPEVVPFVALPIRAASEGPVERFRAP